MDKRQIIVDKLEKMQDVFDLMLTKRQYQKGFYNLFPIIDFFYKDASDEFVSEAFDIIIGLDRKVL
jgi:hypothetical protein